MRVVVVGKDNVMKWPHNLAAAMTNAGHNVARFIHNRAGWKIRLKKSLSLGDYRQDLALSFLELCVRHRPELIVFVSPFFTHQSLFDVLGQVPGSPVLIGWEGENFDQAVREKTAHLDQLFFTDTGYIDKSEHIELGCPVDYLPHGYSEKLFHRIDVPRDQMPFFVGIPNPARVTLFASLRESCAIYGAHWDAKLLSQHRVRNRRIALKDLHRFYNQTSAALTVFSPETNISGMNMRVFEASACGALVLTDAMRDLPLCYEVGTEVLVYRSAAELDGYLRALREDPDCYRAVAEAGYQRTLADHGYQARAQRIVEAARQLRAN